MPGYAPGFVMNFEMCGDAARRAPMPAAATLNAPLGDLSNAGKVEISLLSRTVGASVVVVFTSRILSQATFTIRLCLPIGVEALSIALTPSIRHGLFLTTYWRS